MIEVCNISDCCGCGACHAVCPHGAIRMSPGLLGALHPEISQEKCVDCGLCRKVCSVVNPVRKKDSLHSYCAYDTSDAGRASSASGGAASALAEAVLSAGGVVYGCAQKPGPAIGHLRVDSLDDVALLKGSKYVQSSLEAVYEDIRNDLDRDLDVLFIGTPCQVAGVLNYTSMQPLKTGSLYTVDLCCHGVPSDRMLKEHLDYLGFGSSQVCVTFREKTGSRPAYMFKVADTGGKLVYKASAHKDFYMAGFMSGLYCRENCFSCRYACPERCSDITLADHWAMGDSEDPEMILSKGVSTVLVNTSEGESLLSMAAHLLRIEERPFEESLRNGRFIAPLPRPKDYYDFADALNESGYLIACRRHVTPICRKLRRDKWKADYYASPVRKFIRKLFKFSK